MASPVNIPTKTCFYSVIFGIVLIIVGIIINFSKPWLLDTLLPTIILGPHTTIEEFWRKPPTMLSVNIYLFNWTNPQEIYNLSSKPNFEQVGPYRFLQEMEKVDIVWNNNNTVTYKQRRTWFLDEKDSGRNISEEIVTLNLLNWYTAQRIKDWNYIIKRGMSTGLDDICPNSYVKTSVRNILYEGFCGSSVNAVINNFLFLMPEVPHAKAWGLISFKNGSMADSVFNEIYNIGIGVNGDYNIRSFNYRNRTHFKDSCGAVESSAGEIFSKRERDNIELFFPDTCRKFMFDYEEDATVDNILGYKYSFGKRMLDNGTLYPENKCFCSDECIPSGMLNLSDCFFGFPAYMSLPHFYDADPVYLNDVEGLQPSKEKHKSYIIVEPKTGIVLSVLLRFQLNFLIYPVEGIKKFENIPKMYFPMLWMDISFKIPEELKQLLQYFLIIPFVVNIISYTAIVSGFSLLIFGFISYLISKKQIAKNVTLLRPEEVPLQN